MNVKAFAVCAVGLLNAACLVSSARTGPGAGAPQSVRAPLQVRTHITAMAPLTVGSFDAPNDPAQEPAWTQFSQDLAQAKRLGVESISFDVWWGAVESKGDQQFDFAWVDRMVKTITAAGLSFRPVLAFHSCGTNVGDTCAIPLPAWLSARYAGQPVPGLNTSIQSSDDLFYVSAQGHSSEEAVSVWATPLVVEQYREFISAFAQRYGAYAASMSGVAIGLGPASELRYPSYDAQDTNSGYPGPGVLQSYSRLAYLSFRQTMLTKYSSLAGVNQAWGFSLASEDEIRPPDPSDVEGFFARQDHLRLQYGRDFFDWYRGSLLEHGREVLAAASDVLQSSPLKGIRISARVPSVHWRAADTRRAELAAGLISTSDADSWGLDSDGHGYQALVSMFASLRASAATPNVALEFTCLEMGDGEGGPAVGSLAESLVFWIGAEAQRQGVPAGGENALSGGLWTEDGWAHLENVLRWSTYDGLTLLRLTDVVSSPVARREVAALSGVAAAP